MQGNFAAIKVVVARAILGIQSLPAARRREVLVGIVEISQGARSALQRKDSAGIYTKLREDFEGIETACRQAMDEPDAAGRLEQAIATVQRIAGSWSPAP